MKKRYLIPKGLFVCFFLIFSSVCITKLCIVKAEDERNLYQEGVKFDSQGNLLMTTHDKRASGSVRYKTIGWTVWEKSRTEGGGKSVRLSLSSHGTTRTDPENPAYTYSYFICTKEEIFSKIGQVSPEWQYKLYVTGGILYLDAIMTVVEDGEQKGYMNADGSFRGEVYTTSSGIMGARAWTDPDSLLTHFNKKIIFLGVPELFGKLTETHQKTQNYFAYGKTYVQKSNQMLITALPQTNPEFDVNKGIPTGEQVMVTGKLQKYYFEGCLEHHYGTVAVPVEVTVTYTVITMTEKGPVVSTISNTVTRYVNREFSYYRIKDLDLFTLDAATLANESLPQSMLEFNRLYQANIRLERDRKEYVQIPVYRTGVNGGVLGAGGGLSIEELNQAAERAAGEVMVRNDEFVIDSEVILDGSFVKKSAPVMVMPRGKHLLRLIDGPMTISHTKQNGIYDSVSKAIYLSYTKQNSEKYMVSANPVIVHTPVVCKGGITDDIAHNQQVVPTANFSLILGREFTAAVSTIGTHKDQPGYGKRDYKKYIKERQICFPFETFDKDLYGRDRYIPANQWVSLPEQSKTFYLPVGVHEGDYTIRYRTLAANADAALTGRDANEYLANLSLDNYGAYDELNVTVIGRMYDLAVTDVVDYPRWKSTFYKEDGSRNDYAFWVGHNNLEGNLSEFRKNHGFAPILPGDHPYNPGAGAPGLGYRIRFELKTIGDMRSGQDSILLIPHYYYISRDGRQRTAVKLYQKKDLTEIYRPIVLTAKNRRYLPVLEKNVADPFIRQQSVQLWEGECQLSPDLYLLDARVDLDQYIRTHGGRIKKRDALFLQNGYLLVQFEIISCSSAADNSNVQYKLCYINQKNAKNGYCNMWQLQGFLHHRLDAGGVCYNFEDGDFLMFDTRYSLHSDYESWGTH